jgi:hypothetical protein
MVIVVAIITFSLPCFGQLNGSGTQEDPYIISSYEDLLFLSNTTNLWTKSKYFIQTNDIDASLTYNQGIDDENFFSPIGSVDDPFNGTYDGQGYSISNLYIHKTTSFAGIFGKIQNASISNLHVVNADFYSLRYSGGIVAYASDSSVSNCSSSGNITAYAQNVSYSAGIIGACTNNCRVMNSYSTAHVSGYKGIGGITNIFSCTLELANCYFTGSLEGQIGIANQIGIGGLIGIMYSENDISLRDSYVTASISANELTSAGMIIGYSESPQDISLDISACFYEENETIASLGETIDKSFLQESSIIAINQAQMQESSTFINCGWHFDTIWFMEDENINNGLPYLFWQNNRLSDLLSVDNEDQDTFISLNLNTQIQFCNPLPPGNNLLINQFDTNSTVLTGLADSDQALGDKYWRISTSYTDTLTYDLTFNLQDIESYFNDNCLKIYKRANASEAWVNVLELGASISCIDKIVTVSGLYSFSDFIPVLDESSLPVQISSFSAITAAQGINITWEVESETNLLGYYLFWGKTNNFACANLIPSLIHASNSSQLHQYTFTHETDILTDYLYYWLQSVEHNNDSSLYGPIMIKLSNTNDNHPSITWGNNLFPSYPNPFNPQTRISFSIERPQNVNIAIYNTKGQLVKNLLDAYVDKSKEKLDLIWQGDNNNNVKVASGAYIVVMRTSDKRYSKKIILQK